MSLASNQICARDAIWYFLSSGAIAWRPARRQSPGSGLGPRQGARRPPYLRSPQSSQTYLARRSGAACRHPRRPIACGSRRPRQAIGFAEPRPLLSFARCSRPSRKTEQNWLEPSSALRPMAIGRRKAPGLYRSDTCSVRPSAGADTPRGGKNFTSGWPWMPSSWTTGARRHPVAKIIPLSRRRQWLPASEIGRVLERLGPDTTGLAEELQATLTETTDDLPW